MKKLVLLIGTYLGLVSMIYAQSQSQTINWIKNNKNKIETIDCPTIKLHGDEFQISKKTITLFDEYQACEIKINHIENIEVNNNTIYIISDEKIEQKPLVMAFKLISQ